MNHQGLRSCENGIDNTNHANRKLSIMVDTVTNLESIKNSLQRCIGGEENKVHPSDTEKRTDRACRIVLVYMWQSVISVVQTNTIAEMEAAPSHSRYFLIFYFVLFNYVILYLSRGC